MSYLEKMQFSAALVWEAANRIETLEAAIKDWSLAKDAFRVQAENPKPARNQFIAARDALFAAEAKLRALVQNA